MPPGRAVGMTYDLKLQTRFLPCSTRAETWHVVLQTLKQKGYRAVTANRLSWFAAQWKEKFDAGTECAAPFTLSTYCINAGTTTLQHIFSIVSACCKIEFAVSCSTSPDYCIFMVP